MAMSNQDYEIIASVIKEAREHAQGFGKNFSAVDFAIRLTAAMTNALAEDNPNFDRNVFGRACLPENRDFSGMFGTRKVAH